MKKISALIVSLLMLGAVPAHADEAGAKAFVDSVGSQVLAVLKDGGSKEAQKGKLLALVDSNVDIDFVAKFVLGKWWRTATEDQRQAYLEAYRPFLKNNYVAKLTRYSGQTFKLGTVRADSSGNYSVPMTIVDPQGANVIMMYRVAQNGNNYRIADIVVEGVSLINTQRQEFNSIASGKGIDYLIDALKKKGSAA
jgi:phospholipid transport system substrate-binding protein